jgi:hypothetical protein
MNRLILDANQFKRGSPSTKGANADEATTTAFAVLYKQIETKSQSPT